MTTNAYHIEDAKDSINADPMKRRGDNGGDMMNLQFDTRPS